MEDWDPIFGRGRTPECEYPILTLIRLEQVCDSDSVLTSVLTARGLSADPKGEQRTTVVGERKRGL
jgi:hypothetical protein